MFGIRWVNKINWSNVGLIPVIVQDIFTKNILMFAWMNYESLIRTIITRRAIYFSRSRNKIWVKGSTSGNIQHVCDIFIDCDKDVILLKIKQDFNSSCHTGRYSCFFYKFNGTFCNGSWIIHNLF